MNSSCFIIYYKGNKTILACINYTNIYDLNKSRIIIFCLISSAHLWQQFVEIRLNREDFIHL